MVCNEWGTPHTGKHKPIITKELFQKVHERLTRDRIVRGENKDFAFTKLITCGLCGSGVSAQEKYKKLKDHSTKKYIYYGCTRSRDIQCKNSYMREEELIEKLSNLIDTININNIGIRGKFNNEIERYYKFTKDVLKSGVNEFEKQKKIDIRNYTKYILREGLIIEKREILGCLNSKLVMKDKKIILAN